MGRNPRIGRNMRIRLMRLMAAAGVNDSPEEALTYLKHITRGARRRVRMGRHLHSVDEHMTSCHISLYPSESDDEGGK